MQVRAETLNIDDRTVEIVWAAGAPVRRYDWWEGEYYIEELSMDPAHIRMDRFRSGMSLLDSHMAYSMDDRIGTVIPGSVRIENGLGIATVRISRKQRGEELLQDLRDGHPFPVSVGYKTHGYEKTEASDEALARLVAIDWEPMELSAVPIPADPAAHSRSETGEEPRKVEVAVSRRNPAVEETRNGDPKMPQANKTGRKPGEEANPNGNRADGEAEEEVETEEVDEILPADDESRGQPRTTSTAVVTTSPAPLARTDAANVMADQTQVQRMMDEAAQRAVAGERQRVNQLTLIARQAGVEDAVLQDHIQRNTDVVAFRQVAFDAMVTRQESTGQFPHSPTHVSSENREARRAAVANALMHRHAPDRNELTELGRNYRGLGLIDVAREMLREDGVNVRGMVASEIAARAFHSTSDFPIILQGVIRTSLRQSYEAYPQTFQPFSRRTTAPDFKDINTVQLSEGPRLLKINEHGEYKRGTLRESKQAYSIATYGRIVGVTRQLLINDDLGAFTRIPQLYGAAIAQLESDLVWDVIVSNLVMSDGNALFHASHGNVVDASAFSAKSLGELRTKMAKQLGMDGKTQLNLRPKFLLIAPELEFIAEQLLGSVQTSPQLPNQVTPASLRQLQLIVEPRLSAINDGMVFILVADNNQIDTIEYAYLEGEQGAYMETKEGWDVDGMEVKCRLDFGATAIDWKGFARNEGAAQPA